MEFKIVTCGETDRPAWRSGLFDDNYLRAFDFGPFDVLFVFVSIGFIFLLDPMHFNLMFALGTHIPEGRRDRHVTTASVASDFHLGPLHGGYR